MDKVELGTARGWTYYATPRGSDRFAVYRIKGSKHVFMQVAHSLEQARRIARYHMEK